MKKKNLNGKHKLVIANQVFNSRLMLGTGKYKNTTDAIDSIKISRASIVTIAVRRVDMNHMNQNKLLHTLDWNKLWLLPNTAGCTSAEEAIRMARLGREISKRIGQIDNKFIKLEVIPDSKYLLPDPIGTLKAAEYLTKKNFKILAYTNNDPIIAKELEDIGCAAIMPLGSPIGSGQGLQNPFNLSIIIKNSKIPVIIDAGIGTASEASQAMELGADGVLMNTAIAKANSSRIMAYAMRLAVESGKYANLAGRMKTEITAQASSPMKNMFFK